MIRRVRLFVAPLVMLAVLLPMLGGTASAEASLKISTDNCTLLDGTGQPVTVTPTKSSFLFTNNSTSDVVSQCGGAVTPSASGKAIQFDYASTGARCAYVDLVAGTAIVTEDWHETVTPNGQAKITCHFKSPVVIPLS